MYLFIHCNADVIHVFLLQNGYVFVYTGLIEFVDNKDQLAMVIGHEMAHALMLHAVSWLVEFVFHVPPNS